MVRQRTFEAIGLPLNLIEVTNHFFGIPEYAQISCFINEIKKEGYIKIIIIARSEKVRTKKKTEEGVCKF